MIGDEQEEIHNYTSTNELSFPFTSLAATASSAFSSVSIPIVDIIKTTTAYLITPAADSIVKGYPLRNR